MLAERWPVTAAVENEVGLHVLVKDRRCRRHVGHAVDDLVTLAVVRQCVEHLAGPARRGRGGERHDHIDRLGGAVGTRARWHEAPSDVIQCHPMARLALEQALPDDCESRFSRETANAHTS